MKFLKVTILCLTLSTIFLKANDSTNVETAYTQKKYSQAAKYYKKACVNKHAVACLKLADLYDIGIEIDVNKALLYFKKACEDGCMQVEDRDETKQVGC